MMVWNTYRFKIFYERTVTNNRTVYNSFIGGGGQKCVCLNHRRIKVNEFERPGKGEKTLCDLRLKLEGSDSSILSGRHNRKSAKRRFGSVLIWTPLCFTCFLKTSKNKKYILCKYVTYYFSNMCLKQSCRVSDLRQTSRFKCQIQSSNLIVFLKILAILQDIARLAHNLQDVFEKRTSSASDIYFLMVETLF